MYKDKYFHLIDLGSSKVRFSVFDKDLGEKFSKTRSVKFDYNYTNQFKEIDQIIKEAEKKISSHVNDIILLLDSPEIFTIDISFIKYIDKRIKTNDIIDSLMMELKQLILSNYNNCHILHIIFNNFIVDGQSSNEWPKNKYVNNNLKIDFKVICLPKKLVTKVKDKFIENNLNIVNIFCTSYLKSLSYLRKLQLKKISFLDIGWERTTLMFYEKNKLHFISSVPIGSYHITKDISKIFKISEEDAEKIKFLFNNSSTEFSYEVNPIDDSTALRDIMTNNISIDILKKVILYRIEDIIDLIFKKSNIKSYHHNLSDSELFLIGEGSILFNNNSFYLDDKFEFSSISFYKEKDTEICKSGLNYYINQYNSPKFTNKKPGLFERFFNIFSA